MRWWHRAAAAVVRQGEVPRHVAFIMDGNRRFARREGLEAADGHARGFAKLKEALEWCIALGSVRVVSVFAFSIENFRRPPAEVDALMELAAAKFEEMLRKGGVVDEYGARVQVLGRLDLAPPRLQAVMARLVRRSAQNTRLTLNICFAYTSQDELAAAAGDLAAAVGGGALLPGDVTPSLVSRCLFTGGCPPPDLLVRTSGETRLSDFLLWQCSAAHTHLAFVDALWPDFSCWDLLMVVVGYQRRAPAMLARRDGPDAAAGWSGAANARVSAFLEERGAAAAARLESVARPPCDS